jgi:hypothetical protein
MKTFMKYLLIALLLGSCNNDDDNNTDDPLSQLPPMTTTGENTIGCLVNGEPFTDSGLMNNFYQFINGDYFLGINWDDGNNSIFRDGGIGLRRIEVVEGGTYILNKSGFLDGDYTGGEGSFTSNREDIFGQYETNINFSGEITFSRFDAENQIMSGTFSFEAEEISSNRTISITNGRFDLTFTN